MREITVRGILLAAVLTVVFTAANAYLGLKIGMTFATSIPAAVISMSILRMFKNSSILENNIVQTIASVGGAISAVVLILPGLVILGFWQHFPFWQTFLLCAIGGVLGVLFTIPLRRALVVNSDLPYPEGRAAAETLKVGEQTTAGEIILGHPVRDITIGTIVAFVFDLLSSSFKLLTDSISYYGKFGAIVSGLGFQFSLALVGAGYLIGLRITLAIGLGVAIAWFGAVPILSWHHLDPILSASDFAMQIWDEKVRFIGAGTIGIAAIWATIKLVKPIFHAIVSAIRTSAQRRANQHYAIPLHEQDIPIIWVMVGILFLTLPLAILVGYFTHQTHVLGSNTSIMLLALLCAVLTIVVGFLTAAVSGYMAGLVGSSNSPLSGVGILTTILIALILGYLFNNGMINYISAHFLHFAVALTIFLVSVTFAAACISNDNLQDLSTGHLIGATPWKQQVALIFGVILGSAVLAPVLNELYQAYGFAGALPHPGMDPKLALSVPQASLMAAIAKGIITHHMQWQMLIIGATIGMVCLLLNEILLTPRKWHQISVLSVGFGIYLPPEINLPLIVGGALAYIIKQRLLVGSKQASVIERCALLLACGLIVGEALFGLLNATVAGITDGRPIALVGPGFAPIALVLGTVIFISICVGFYYYVKRAERAHENTMTPPV